MSSSPGNALAATLGAPLEPLQRQLQLLTRRVSLAAGLLRALCHLLQLLRGQVLRPSR